MIPKGLHLDFRRSPPQGWTGILLLIAGIDCLAGLGYLQYQTEKEIAVVQEAIQRMPQKQTNTSDKSPLPPSTAEHRRIVLERIQFPWEAFFQTLESTPAEGVTLLSASPEREQGKIVLRGEARDLYTVMNYLLALQKQASFKRVELLEHDLANQDANLSVQFAITVHWGSR